jgi:hypothetical protein
MDGLEGLPGAARIVIVHDDETFLMAVASALKEA